MRVKTLRVPRHPRREDEHAIADAVRWARQHPGRSVRLALVRRVATSRAASEVLSMRVGVARTRDPRENGTWRVTGMDLRPSARRLTAPMADPNDILGNLSYTIAWRDADDATVAAAILLALYARLPRGVSPRSIRVILEAP